MLPTVPAILARAEAMAHPRLGDQDASSLLARRRGTKLCLCVAAAASQSVANTEDLSDDSLSGEQKDALFAEATRALDAIVRDDLVALKRTRDLSPQAADFVKRTRWLPPRAADVRISCRPASWHGHRNAPQLIQ